MSVGSLQECPPSIAEIMQQTRLLQENLNTSELSSLDSSQSTPLEVEPSSIDATIKQPGDVSPPSSTVNSVSALTPITYSIIDPSLTSNKTSVSNYKSNGLQDNSNIAVGSLIDIKV